MLSERAETKSVESVTLDFDNSVRDSTFSTLASDGGGLRTLIIIQSFNRVEWQMMKPPLSFPNLLHLKLLEDDGIPLDFFKERKNGRTL